MYRSWIFLLSLLFAHVIGTSADEPEAGLPLRVNTEPCLQVGKEVEGWYKENRVVPTDFSQYKDFPEGFLERAIPRIAAAPLRPSLVYKCLKSVPFNQTSALSYVAFLKPMMEWHSSLDYLRSPPPGYLSEPVDLIEGLNEIEDKITMAKYSKEFDFHADLYTLLRTRVRDVHLALQFPLLSLATFKRSPAFVSVSKEGTSIPQVFLQEDVKHNKHRYSPSPVHYIDDQPAVEYLERLSLLAGTTHDPDVRYNTLFNTLSKEANPTYLDEADSSLTMADTTKVKLRNGTVLEFQNAAYVRANFTGIANGKDVFNSWVGEGATGELPLPWPPYTWMERNFTNDFAGFPRPSHRVHDGSLAGFLPSALSKVAVLAIGSFGSFMFNANFSVLMGGTQSRYDTTVDFIRAAKRAGKSKLILDLQGNGGGTWPNLLTLYRLLFPNTSIPLLFHHRAHPQLEWLVQEADRTANTSEPVGSPLNMASWFQPDGSHWSSFSEHFGPVPGLKGLYTRPSRVNATFWIRESSFPVQETEPWTEPPFRPEDIVILLDGECASSCAIFASSLIHGHGVRTVAVGGRAVEAPMQAVGQVKGGSLLSFPLFNTKFDPQQVPSGLDIFTGFNPPRNTGASMEVNEANMTPVGAKTKIPLQFTYEAANCKIFSTWDMLRDIENLWQRVAGVTWDGGKCVKGSTTEKDGRMGGVPSFRQGVEDKYRLPPGPGALAR